MLLLLRILDTPLLISIVSWIAEMARNEIKLLGLSHSLRIVGGRNQSRVLQLFRAATSMYRMLFRGS